MSDRLTHVSGITTRIRYVARNYGVTVDDLASRSDRELMRMDNFGRKSLRLLRECYPAVEQERVCPHCGHEYRITDLDRD